MTRKAKTSGKTQQSKSALKTTTNAALAGVRGGFTGMGGIELPTLMPAPKRKGGNTGDPSIEQVNAD